VFDLDVTVVAEHLNWSISIRSLEVCLLLVAPSQSKFGIVNWDLTNISFVILLKA